jgi:hypothetical protein
LPLGAALVTGHLAKDHKLREVGPWDEPDDEVRLRTPYKWLKEVVQVAIRVRGVKERLIPELCKEHQRWQHEEERADPSVVVHLLCDAEDDYKHAAAVDQARHRPKVNLALEDHSDNEQCVQDGLDHFLPEKLCVEAGVTQADQV